MTQHINLLTRHRARKKVAMVGMVGLGGLILTVVVWGVVNEINLHRLANSTALVQQTVAELRTELQAKRNAAGLEDAQVLAKESSQLRRYMEDHRPLMLLVQKGEVGSLQGHSIPLHTLASLSQTGVWLQGVDVLKAGQSLRISGMATTTAAVVAYAEELNQSFKPVGNAFTSVEMTQDAWAGAVSATSTATSTATPRVSVIKFKLY